MSRELTKKERGFVKDYVKTGNGTQSALKNYDTTDYSTAGNIASENLDKPKIIKAIKSIAESIPDKLLIEKHLALLNKEEVITKTDPETGEIEVLPTGQIDAVAVSKGLDMAYKIKSTYAPDKGIMNVNIVELEDTIKNATALFRNNKGGTRPLPQNPSSI